MAWYKIYAGLLGSYGGAKYVGTYDFDDADEAWSTAYFSAIDIYESYAGKCELPSYDECYQEAIDTLILDKGNEDCLEPEEIELLADQYYATNLEEWIIYEAKEATNGH